MSETKDRHRLGKNHRTSQQILEYCQLPTKTVKVFFILNLVKLKSLKKRTFLQIPVRRLFKTVKSTFYTLLDCRYYVKNSTQPQPQPNHKPYMGFKQILLYTTLPPHHPCFGGSFYFWLTQTKDDTPPKSSLAFCTFRIMDSISCLCFIVDTHRFVGRWFYKAEFIRRLNPERVLSKILTCLGIGPETKVQDRKF